MSSPKDNSSAEIIITDWDAASVMGSVPVETIKSILGRTGILYEDGLPKDVYIAALYDAFTSDPSMILTVLTEDMIYFLIEVWEKDHVGMDAQRWNYMEYLKLFGLLAYRRGNAAIGESDIIYVIPEMKELFYFQIKSKKSRSFIARNTEWEKIITGFMYYYGFIDTKIMHELFIKVSSSLVGYDEFMHFLTGRCSFWAFGSLLKDIYGRAQYFQYHTVKNTELLVLYIKQHEDCPYKKISKDDLIYVSEGSGIDNRWKGVSELAILFYNESAMDYYRATVMIRTIIDMIQNGKEFDEVRGQLDLIHFNSEETKQKALTALTTLYANVPLFEYKGHSRKEAQDLFHIKNLKEKHKNFKLIKGGKE